MAANLLDSHGQFDAPLFLAMPSQAQVQNHVLGQPRPARTSV